MAIDPATVAFVFPGQGSQTVGMGRELAESFAEARATFEEADAILGFPLSRLMWEGPEAELNDTINTQPALFVHSLAAYRAVRARHPALVPAYSAGHSLGELSAIAASGALGFAEGLRLVRTRGELMKRAGDLHPGGMAAILGVDIPALDKICAQAGRPGEIVQVANDNCPGQVVISGDKSALERALAAAKSAGAKRALPLAVSIAAHSPLMASIQADWSAAVLASSCSDGETPVVGNVQALPMRTVSEFRADILAQMQSRVRWTESIKFVAGQGVTTFIEVGTGTVLGGLIKRIQPGVTTLPLGRPADFEALN